MPFLSINRCILKGWIYVLGYVTNIEVSAMGKGSSNKIRYTIKKLKLKKLIGQKLLGIMS